MKISKLLSKIYLSIFVILISLLSLNLNAEEELIDIWKIEKKIDSENLIESEINTNSELNDITIGIEDINTSEIIKNTELEENNIILAGIYDPAENGLSIDMWSNSDGNEITKILNRLEKKKLSNDAKKILDIALLTNSYFPNQNINEEKFFSYKLNYLIKNDDLELIRLYLSKNSNYNNNKVIKFYADKYLSNSNLKNACEIFKDINLFDDNYLTKFKIYCLINENRNEEAQLIFDLVKELDFTDKFFEKKFNILMGYSTEPDKDISDTNILDFHLSHRTNETFLYKPNNNTSKIIWKYLSSSNLLQKVDAIDLKNKDEILIIEKATHEKIYNEKELFELYKRFQFNFIQLLTATDNYKLLPSYEGRALLYQRLLLSDDSRDILDLASKLKNSFGEENIGNAFYQELSNILLQIDPEKVPSDFSTFYQRNLIIDSFEKSKIKYNNKIIHQSKLLKYFQQKHEIEKIQKDLVDILKNIKKNKKYFVSNKDLILLESLISDGIQIPKKYQSLFELNQSDIPNDINLLINNNETGLVLLRLVEIIGEDKLMDIGSENVYFMVSILNKLNLDKIRNKILLQVLPLKV